VPQYDSPHLERYGLEQLNTMKVSLDRHQMPAPWVGRHENWKGLQGSVFDVYLVGLDLASKYVLDH
jgi:hypothetical protein